MDSYLSIADSSVAEFKEKGSRFIAYAYFIENEEDVKTKIEILKKEHFKATHHCYAFRLGTEGKLFRANDDGEPSGTAGRPILGQIDSFGLSNVLIVVVRYYGGTKLGTSGLIAAYKEAAKMALELANKEIKLIESELKIQSDYVNLSEIMQFLKNQNIIIKSSDYTDYEVILNLSIVNSQKSLICAFIENLRTKGIIIL
jgi:uncharacterized YigZ family protein